MAGDPQMYIKVAANIADLKAALIEAKASVETAGEAAQAAGEHWADLGRSWVLRVAEGMLLRDAIREVIEHVKELIVYLPELALQGAHVAEIEESFQRLTAQAGLLADALLDTLREATHGTITDFELMKRVNQDLAAGMNLTSDQFELLARGAFALAKATGTDVKTALDTMNDAMLTGRTRAIALLTGKIDLKAAEDAYAESLGESSKELSADEKLQVAREAVLKAVGAAIERLGAQTDGLDEKVTQAQVAWKNFEDKLGATIATSKVIAAGFDSLKASLLAAFGGDQQALIAAIAKKVDDLAVLVVDLGIGATQVATVLVAAWSAIQTPILAVETAIVGLVTTIGEVLLKAEELAGKLHIVSPDEIENIHNTQLGLRAMTVSLAEQTAEAAKGVVGQSALNAAIDKGAGMLFKMRDDMIAARTATAEWVGPLNEVTEAQQALTAAINDADAAVVNDMGSIQALNELWEFTHKNVLKAMKEETAARDQRTKEVNNQIIAEAAARQKADAEYRKTLDVLIGGAADVGDANKKAAATAQEGYQIAFYNAGGGFAAFKGAVLQGNAEMAASAFGLASAYANVMSNIGTPQAVGGYRSPTSADIAAMAAASQRQSGGPVETGRPYLVGERGPEMFVPDRAGTVLPHGAGGLSMTNHFVINGSVLSDEHKIATAVGDALMNTLRGLGLRLPVNR